MSEIKATPTLVGPGDIVVMTQIDQQPLTVISPIVGGAPGVQGPPGPPGPEGPEGGTEVIGVPADEWPPPDPQPDTLYLKLI